MNRLKGISVLFILLSFCKLGLAQNEYTLNVENVNFEELIDHLESNLSIKLAYNSDLSPDQTFSFNHQAGDLQSLLEPVWDAANLESQYVADRQVLIRPMPIKKNPKINYIIQVKDPESATPLDMVAVAISGTNYGTYTDINGLASLTVNEADKGKDLILHLLGYDEIKISLGDNTNISVDLEKSDIKLEEILIEDRRNILKSNPIDLKQDIALNQLSLTTSGVLGSDILRSAQLMSGISAHNDRSAGLQIRGSDDDQALIMMDGIPIYNPTHYFGVFSAINSSYVDQASVYKNNLPIEFGGKTSGMLQLQSDDAADLSHISGVADINLLTSSLVLKIPVSESVRLFLNGRTTYNNVSESGLASLFSNEDEVTENIQNFSLFTRDQILSSVPDYKFNDWNAKLQFKPSENHLIDLNFYQSNDQLVNAYSNTFENRRDRQRFQITENFNNTENWSNLGASLNLSSKLNDNWTMNSNAYYSSFDNDSEIATSIATTNPNNPNILSKSNFVNNYINDYGGKVYVSHQSEGKWDIKLGLDYSHKESALDISGEQIDQFNNTLTADIYSAFGSARMNLSNGWILNAGVRSSYFSPTEKVYFSPRLNLAKTFDNNLTLKASAGRQYQFAKELSFETPQGRTQSLWVIGGTEKIPVNQSNNFMLGGTYRLGRFALDIEGFYRTTEGVNEYAFFNSQFVEDIDMGNFVSYQLYSGINKNYGADFSLSYTDKLYTGWLAYTLSKGTNSFAEIARGTEYPSQEDRRHQLKLVNNVNLKPITFSLNLIYSSGRPYTDLVQFDSNNNRNNINPRDRQRRLPHYFRMDAGVDYNFSINSHQAKIGLSVFNLTDRNNVDYLQYIFSINSNRQDDDKLVNTILGTETNLLPQTINLNFSYKF